MELKISKKVEVKFFEVSYGDGDNKIIYIAKNKKQVSDAENVACGLEGLDYIKELVSIEVNKKRQIGKKLSSFKEQAILILGTDGIALPKTIASAGIF